MSEAVLDTLEAYFSTLNSTSSRMMADIINLRQEHQNRWKSMTHEEQSEALWQSLVHPAIQKKYNKLATNCNTETTEYFPVLRIKPGEKVIVDEDASSNKPFGCTWRDEHSAPFRWETQSQLELRISNDDNSSKTTTLKDAPSEKISDVKKDDDLKRPLLKRPEVPPPPVPPHATPPIPPHAEMPPVPPHIEKTEMPIYAKVVKRKSSAKTLVISEMKAHRRAMEEMKPAIPPRMSLELKGDIDHTKFKGQTTDNDGIPKTGFDFLDNW